MSDELPAATADPAAADGSGTVGASLPADRDSMRYRMARWFWGYDYFISYHWSSGGAYAVALAQRLRDRKYDVFLDRAEYAAGDDWKGVGERALRNTQRLVLVATREAVTLSVPVAHEVSLFTGRGRQVVPIIFADRAAGGGRSSLADLDRGKHPVLARMSESQLYIEDDLANLSGGPPDVVIDRLTLTYRVMRRRNIRATLLGFVVAVLVGFAAFALVSWVNALIAHGQAVKEGNRARARYLVAQGQIEFDGKPLLGLRLALEGLALMPSDSSNVRDSLAASTAELAKWGRFAKLGDDVEWVFVRPYQGDRLVVGHKQGVARYCDPDGRVVATLRGPNPRAVFSPDPAAAYFVVRYDFDKNWEVRRSTDGGIIVGLEGEVRSINFSPDPAATYFLVEYADRRREVRRSADGRVTAALSAQTDFFVEFSPDPNATYFVVNFGNYRRVVRRSADGGITADLDSHSGRHDMWVRFCPTASCFVASYADGAAEVRSCADGKVTAKLTGPIYRDQLHFAPGASGSCFVVQYPNAPGELRSSNDGQLLAQLPDKIAFVTFSPGPAPTYFVVSYYDAAGELRRCADGRLIAKLTGKSSSAWFDSSSTRFVVRYEDLPGELRECADGRLIAKLAGRIVGASDGVRFSSDLSSTYFAVQYAGKLGIDTEGLEVRHRDGAVIAEIRKVGSREPGYPPGEVEFSPDPSATFFVVHFAGDGIEVRRSADGKVAAKLDSRAVTIGKRFKGFSPSPSASFFVVGDVAEPGQLRSCIDGQVVARLPVSINSVDFRRESDKACFMVCGSDNAREVWGIHPSVHRLTALGLGVGQIEVLQDQRAVAVYNDGRAYLLDLAWLCAMEGNPAALSADELLQTARAGPFARGLFDELTLAPYLDGRPPMAFR